MDSEIRIRKESYVASINGGDCRTKKDLIFEISRVFGFGENFGQNLDALSDSLTDLSWISSRHVVLIINDIDNLLCEESEKVRGGLVQVFYDTIEYWESESVERDKTFNVFYTDGSIQF